MKSKPGGARGVPVTGAVSFDLFSFVEGVRRGCERQIALSKTAARR